jgi:hypothetical protein
VPLFSPLSPHSMLGFPQVMAQWKRECNIDRVQLNL